jgi:hypothetical protein
MMQDRPNRQGFGGIISIICAYFHSSLFATFRVFSLGMLFVIYLNQVCKQSICAPLNCILHDWYRLAGRLNPSAAFPSISNRIIHS